MTVRAKPIGSRSSRPSRMDDGRRNLLITSAFAGVVVLAIVILLGAVGINWYTDNFGEVAAVNGSTINRSDFRDRYGVEFFRLDYAKRRLRDELAAGRITQADHDAQVQFIQQRLDANTLQQSVLARLIDTRLEAQLAPGEGVTVTDADVDAKMLEYATRPEVRHAWVIAVDPSAATTSDQVSDADKSAARAKLEKALADIAGGKTFQDVASAVSTDPSALQEGDLGYITSNDETHDPAFHDALFAASKDTPTAIVEGADGIFRVGLVTDIAPAVTDADFEQQYVDSKITTEAYRAYARTDVIRDRLEEKITSGATTAESLQRRASQIFLTDAGPKARVRHILFSPNDDPDAAADLPADDPAWAAAEKEAQALYDQLAAAADDTARLAAFTTAAATSDDDSTIDSGGLLPFYAQDELDPAFGDAIFADGLTKGELLKPVKSSFGWHVIMFDERQDAASKRIEDIRAQATRPLSSFEAIARAQSEGDESVDGGDLGWIARGQLSEKAVEDAIFAAPIGEVSQVLYVPQQGYYIFKVSEEATRMPDAKQVEILKTTAYQNWYAAKRDAADIKLDSSVQAPVN